MSSIEERLDQLERRARYLDEVERWFTVVVPWQERDNEINRLRELHGVRPIPERGERVRWFRSEHYTREYPSRRMWLNHDGQPCESPTIASIDECIRYGDIELDGPPPHGKPLAAQPATGGDGMEERAHRRWVVTPEEWDTGITVRAAVDFARSEVARATAAKDAEIERLNALVNKLDASV